MFNPPRFALAWPALLLLASARLASAQLQIVDLISRNDEAEQNSEPSLAVNPANADQVFVSASAGVNPASQLPHPALIFFTENGGAAWSIQQRFAATDGTLAWAAGGDPFLTHLIAPSATVGASLLVRRGLTPLADARFEILPSATYTGTRTPDQPWVVTSRAAGQDRIFVTFNDLNTKPNTASIQFSLDGGATWKRQVLERTFPEGGQDGPAVRSAVLGETVYVALQRWNSLAPTLGGSAATGEVVVLKDLNAGRDGFRALGAAGVGIIVQSGLKFPLGEVGLGQERLGSGLSLVVDPGDAEVLYLACDVYQDAAPRITVFRSADGGKTWKPVHQTRPHTARPALAISANGTIGLAYSGFFNDLLETHLLQTPDGFATLDDKTLSRFRDRSLTTSFNSSIGDYPRLVAAGGSFLGVFSASNDTALFPQPVTFLRDQSQLGGVVPFSTDSFFFRTPAITVAPTPTLPLAGDDQVHFQSSFGTDVDILANDSEPSGDALSVLSFTHGAAGTVRVLSSGKLNYNPSLDFTGVDNFTYTITNSVGKTATAAVQVRNPFFAARGAYSGLARAGATAAYLKCNLSAHGQFTGKLRFSDQAYVLDGAFDLTGKFTTTIQRPRQPPLAINLELDFQTGLISGSVSDGTLSLALEAGLASYTANNPAPEFGSYTFTLPRLAGDSTVPFARGPGYGVVRVGVTGALQAVGVLNDGYRFSQGAQISNAGQWPLFGQIHGQPSRGVIVGEVQFADLATTDLSAPELTVVRERVRTALPPFKAAYVLKVTLAGSRYTPPASGERAFLASQTGLGMASFPDMTAPNLPFKLNRHQLIKSEPAPGATLRLEIDPLSGLLSGEVLRQGTLQSERAGGVILQKTNNAFGQYRNPLGVGALELSARPTP